MINAARIFAGPKRVGRSYVIIREQPHLCYTVAGGVCNAGQDPHKRPPQARQVVALVGGQLPLDLRVNRVPRTGQEGEGVEDQEGWLGSAGWTCGAKHNSVWRKSPEDNKQTERQYWVKVVVASYAHGEGLSECTK